MFMILGVKISEAARTMLSKWNLRAKLKSDISITAIPQCHKGWSNKLEYLALKRNISTLIFHQSLTKHRACLDTTLLFWEKCIINDKGGVTGKYFKVSMPTTVITFKQHVTLSFAANAAANSSWRYTCDYIISFCVCYSGWLRGKWCWLKCHKNSIDWWLIETIWPWFFLLDNRKQSSWAMEDKRYYIRI